MHGNSLNPEDSLEFFLNGDKIFVLYLVDILDFVKDRPEYWGNPLYPFQPDHEEKGGFVVVNVLFDDITYNAVRFRNFSPSKTKQFKSDNHIFGKRLRKLQNLTDVSDAFVFYFVFVAQE